MLAKEKISYPKLILNVFKSVSLHKSLKWTLITNASVFGVVFNLFWTLLTFPLAAGPFGFNLFQIGLASLADITGAAASFEVGKLWDKGPDVSATGIFIGILLVSMLLCCSPANH